MTVDVVRAPHAVARALAATFLVLVTATTAHTRAGGDLPPVPGLALLGAVVLGCSLACFRWGVPGWALLPAVVLAQLGLHELFGPASAPPAHAGHHHLEHAAAGPTWQMVAAHLVGAGVTALVWWWGRSTGHAVVALRRRPPRWVRRGHALGVPPTPAALLGRRDLVLVAPDRGPPVPAGRA